MTNEEYARRYLEETRDLSREQKTPLYDRLPTAVKDAVRRLMKQAFFVPENAKLDSRTVHLSPSERYKLIVTPYATSPGSWAYSQGLVYRLADHKLVAEVQRNYCAFPFAWVEGHVKGDFLVCGEDYQGQTIINLVTGAREDHLPRGAMEGVGFCWAAIHPSPTGKVLAIEGCFWGAPYEIRFYDFEDPMSPPWPMISSGGELSDFLGWKDDEHARIGAHDEIYQSLGKSERDLIDARRKGEITQDQFDGYLDDETGWQEQEVNVREWVRPSTLESLTTFANENLGWFREKNIKVASDVLSNTRVLVERLTSAEREKFGETNEKVLVDWAFANEGTP